MKKSLLLPHSTLEEARAKIVGILATPAQKLVEYFAFVKLI